MPAQDFDTAQQAQSATATGANPQGELQIQPVGFLVQLSLDWIILRASENANDFLGESHVTLIDEPLSRFVQAQSLHDLRNLFSRLSGSTGIARAYRVRMTDDRPRFDIAFQLSRGHVLLEAAPSPSEGFGEAIGSVGGLIDSLSEHRGDSLLKEAARRMRALTGYDRCLVTSGEQSAESSRGKSAAMSSATPGLPAIVADTGAAPVPIFPRQSSDSSIAGAILRSPSADVLQPLRNQGIGSVMTIPLLVDGEPPGVIQCTHRSATKPNFELHAAAELFAQMLALRMQVDRLRGASAQ